MIHHLPPAPARSCPKAMQAATANAIPALLGQPVMTSCTAAWNGARDVARKSSPPNSASRYTAAPSATVAWTVAHAAIAHESRRWSANNNWPVTTSPPSAIQLSSESSADAEKPRCTAAHPKAKMLAEARPRIARRMPAPARRTRASSRTWAGRTSRTDSTATAWTTALARSRSPTVRLSGKAIRTASVGASTARAPQVAGPDIANLGDESVTGPIVRSEGRRRPSRGHPSLLAECRLGTG